jgi:YHS domain-containing protein
MPNDPVKVADATKNKMYQDYKGRRYYFCCAGCPEAFKKDPAKYAKNASLPTPKPAKKK